MIKIKDHLIKTIKNDRKKEQQEKAIEKKKFLLKLMEAVQLVTELKMVLIKVKF